MVARSQIAFVWEYPSELKRQLVAIHYRAFSLYCSICGWSQIECVQSFLKINSICYVEPLERDKFGGAAYAMCVSIIVHLYISASYAKEFNVLLGKKW